MTSKWAVATAVFINYVLGLAVFITPEENKEATNIGPVPGLIILISIAILLTNIQLVPISFKNEYVKTFFVIEVIMSLLCCEFFMLKVWTKIEEYIFTLTKFLLGRGNLFEEMGGVSFISLLVSGITLSFLLYAINATNSARSITKYVFEIYNSSEMYIKRLKELVPGKKACLQGENIPKTCEPIQIYNCTPRCVTPIVLPYTRNPQCPLHGDHEVNQQYNTRSSRKRKY